VGAQAAESRRDPEEQALEKRARDLEKKKKQLEDEVARSGLGADLQPVPEPTCAIECAAAKSGRGKKAAQPEPVKEPRGMRAK